MEKHICPICQKSFEIQDENKAFYSQIKVSEPTFCPECRLLQRLVWRNEKTLYRRECDMCKKNIVSIYAPDSKFTIYCQECFHSDNWDPMSYGDTIDFKKSFFKQFQELQLKVPRLASFVFQNVDSEYVNGAAFNKNCYMMFVSDHNEDSFYSYATFGAHASSDLLNCNECEMCYGSSSCTKCYRVFFSEDCSGSQDLFFCKNCSNCQNCIGSVNLKNTQYAIFNNVVSKEEYERAVVLLSSRTACNEIYTKFLEFKNTFPTKYFHGMRNVNVTGDYVSNSKNSKFVFDSEGVEDCAFINHGHDTKNSHDSYVLVDKSENSYNVVSGIALNNTIASYCVWHGYNIEYSDTCENSHDIFGCVGLRKKEYVILNHQYSKEEYEKLLPQVIEHIKNMPYKDTHNVSYTYGDFFPPIFSPFAYNETVAEEYVLLKKEEALQRGFSWKDENIKKYTPTLLSGDIPDTIQDTTSSITNEIIECAHKGMCADHCTTAFKITGDELTLYKRLGLPIPNICFNCRHAQRIKERNPRKLWNRECMCKEKNHTHTEKCTNKFETSYGPERKEIVYCESCYQQEVS